MRNSSSATARLNGTCAAPRLKPAAASKMKNGLFRILSHELKTPLVALIGLTDVLAEALKDKVEAIEAEQLGHIVGASQRLNRLISDILVLSKSFSGASSLTRFQ